jgi:hypothetical protein
MRGSLAQAKELLVGNHFVCKVDDNNPRKSAHETSRRMSLEN